LAVTTVSLGRSAQFAELMQIESAAITRAASLLDPEHVERALSLIVGCRGRVIVIGLGKSGLIAQKIAATMTSTGTPAVYLHPADALHGDIGIVVPGDVALLLSNSGETDELIALLPHLRHRQTPTIAITGNMASTIARLADVVLEASVDREVCPFNLAPTASTTVALAIGDVLAVMAMQERGASAADFAINHPAGRLGKRLTLRVYDLMGTGVANPQVEPDASWLVVLGAIGAGGVGAVSVIDQNGVLCGIITDGDLRRTLCRVASSELDRLRAISLMTVDPLVVGPEALAYDALQLMENRRSQIAVLPVVDEQRRSIGLLRLHDIVRSGV